MTQFSGYITAPYQGVSQAAAQVRLDAQCAALEDCLVTIPQGVTKRPPFEWVGTLTSHPGHTNGLFERIERPGNADVLLTATLEASVLVPRVYSLSAGGAMAPVSVTIGAAAQTYLNTTVTNPQQDLNALTINDYTFLSNRTKAVANVAGTSAARAKEAMIWVRQAAYARTFSVTVTPTVSAAVTSTVTTPDGTAATDGPFVGTDVIATALKAGAYGGAGIHGGAYAGAGLDTLVGFTVTVTGSVIYITHPTQDFTVAVKDDLGGVALTVIKDSVQSFSDLPKVAKDGFVTKVTQTSGTNADDFYVKFVQTAGPGTGVWQETIAPSTNLGIDPNTMPVGLYNNGTWQLQVLGWKARSVGDANLVPDPPFVGLEVQDITFWRNRLAIISGEGVTLSSAADPFQLYPTTLATGLTSDAMSFETPFPNRTTFRYGVNYDKSLVLFGDKGQAELTARDAVATPSNTKLDILTSFEFSPKLRPVDSNGKVYFVAPNGTRWAKVFELKVNEVTAVTDGEDMNVATPKYLPAASDRVASCPVNYLNVYGTSGGTQLIAHLFRYSDDDRVQNAWMRWNLPEGYLLGGMWFDNTRLHALLCRSGVAHLVRLDTAADLLDEGSDVQLTCLDMRLDETQVTIAYDAVTDRTTLTLPYAAEDTVEAMVRYPGGLGGLTYAEGLQELPEGYAATVYGTSGNDLILTGDYRVTPLYIGHRYIKRYRPSTIYAKTADEKPILSGRTSLRRLHVSLGPTGYVRAEVTAKGRAIRAYEFLGTLAGDPDTPSDEPPNAEGAFTVPVMSLNTNTTIEFVNDSPLRSAILGFEWIAENNPKTQRT